jgi:hypothetical protein
MDHAIAKSSHPRLICRSFHTCNLLNSATGTSNLTKLSLLEFNHTISNIGVLTSMFCQTTTFLREMVHPKGAVTAVDFTVDWIAQIAF